jgi:Ca2+-binding RTX toxin-like protein
MNSFVMNGRRGRRSARAALALLGGLAVAAPARAADLDLNAGVLSYFAGVSDTTPNALSVLLVGDTYIVDDPAVASIVLGSGALGQGCATSDPNTVTCPVAAVASFSIDSRLGNDTIVLSGAVHPATVRPGDGNDTVVGGAGDDVFLWSPGDDSDDLDGGPGSDTLDFSGSNAAENYNIVGYESFELFRDVASVQMYADAIESLILRTSGSLDRVTTTGLLATTQTIIDAADAQADLLVLDAAGVCAVRQGDTLEIEGRGPILFTDFAQVDVVDAFCHPDPCDNAVPTGGCRVNGVSDQPCQGTEGDDLIIGTLAGDVIRGGGGRDRIRSGAGDDVVCGQGGDDTLVGSLGNDTLVGGAGFDKLRGSSGDDTLLGGDDDDQLAGGSGLDDLDGGAGDDRVRGGGDADTVRGGAGDDWVDGGGDVDFCLDADQAGPFARCELP